ncbi:UNVERIFIED_CONTAM: Retrovirus-related Pol polyprotein from transposon TNT 1-94 [Sesamum latifolium]|uniref:Retrovirus-related Pol polyprotein from transposon TNT 1-94 n=1 Tax=Sesamum latifolium TaxID=2727402 RepID=A0AAW2XXQ9_9LAMI
MEKVPYSNAIGSIMFLMVCTRSDIAYAISCLSRYMTNAGPPHWEALKWLLRYPGVLAMMKVRSFLGPGSLEMGPGPRWILLIFLAMTILGGPSYWPLGPLNWMAPLATRPTYQPSPTHLHDPTRYSLNTL